MKVKVKFITVSELADKSQNLFGIQLTVSHIYTLVRKRKIPFTKLGGKLLFDEKKIKDWVAAQTFKVEK